MKVTPETSRSVADNVVMVDVAIFSLNPISTLNRHSEHTSWPIRTDFLFLDRYVFFAVKRNRAKPKVPHPFLLSIVACHFPYSIISPLLQLLHAQW